MRESAWGFESPLPQFPNPFSSSLFVRWSAIPRGASSTLIARYRGIIVGRSNFHPITPGRDFAGLQCQTDEPLGEEEIQWVQQDSNPRPRDYESPALTAELWTRGEKILLCRHSAVNHSVIHRRLRHQPALPRLRRDRWADPCVACLPVPVPAAHRESGGMRCSPGSIHIR